MLAKAAAQQWKEAVEHAEKMLALVSKTFKNSKWRSQLLPYPQFKMCCYLSRMKTYDVAIIHLKAAQENGFLNYEEVEQEPSLVELREAEKEDYTEIIELMKQLAFEKATGWQL